MDQANHPEQQVLVRGTLLGGLLLELERVHLLLQRQALQAHPRQGKVRIRKPFRNESTIAKGNALEIHRSKNKRNRVERIETNETPANAW